MLSQLQKPSELTLLNYSALIVFVKL